MKKTPKRLTTMAIVLAAMFVVMSATRSSQAQSNAGKVDGFVKHSGYEFVNPAENAWGIKRPSGLVIVAVADDIVIIGMVVAQKANFKASAEMGVDMLTLAHRLDYLKVGLDDDGDLFVRAEIKVTAMTQADFDDVLKRVVKGSDDAAAKLKPYLIK